MLMLLASVDGTTVLLFWEDYINERLWVEELHIDFNCFTLWLKFASKTLQLILCLFVYSTVATDTLHRCQSKKMFFFVYNVALQTLLECSRVGSSNNCYIIGCSWITPTTISDNYAYPKKPKILRNSNIRVTIVMIEDFSVKVWSVFNARQISQRQEIVL